MPKTTIDSINPGMSSGRPMIFSVPRVAIIAKNDGNMHANVSGPSKRKTATRTTALMTLIRKNVTPVLNRSSPMLLEKNSGSNNLTEDLYAS